MAILPNLTHKFKAIPIEFQLASLETDKLILKSICNCNVLRIAKKNFKENIGGLTFPNFKTYYKATIIKAV